MSATEVIENTEATQVADAAVEAEEAKPTYVIPELDSELRAEIEASIQQTDSRCKDPGRDVVKRTFLIALIQRVLGVEITQRQMNAVVSLVSRKIPRRPLTIEGASRAKYLLPDAAVDVMAIVIAEPEILTESVELARKLQEGVSSADEDEAEDTSHDGVVTVTATAEPDAAPQAVTYSAVYDD